MLICACSKNSFGHSCIYLLGGPTREQSPTPILLQSGDILVMTGPCRSAFHGNPQFLQNNMRTKLFLHQQLSQLTNHSPLFVVLDLDGKKIQKAYQGLLRIPFQNTSKRTLQILNGIYMLITWLKLGLTSISAKYTLQRRVPLIL